MVSTEACWRPTWVR